LRVICPNCAADNKPGRKFCVGCAVALALACPSCGAPYDPGDRFCGDCATPLAPDPVPVTASGSPASPAVAAPHVTAAPLAERRLVSVLFADLVGFTPFSEERDAEEVRDTLTRYFELATEVIERYGGTVEKFIGDAVMALWGAPTAREDDAERAVRAGLELVDVVRSLAPGIQARAGVLTGEAAVTVGATNQGLVAGDLVNTAARLQSVAAPGALLVGEATMRATSAAIAYEDAGEHVLKGKVAPAAAWRALRVVAERGGRGRSDMPEPPFVGRDEELRLLKDMIATTGRDRRTRLVSISGPGGIGKSRLAWELEKYADGIDQVIYWHRGRSPAYGEGISFWALGEMVRQRAGLAEGDDAATTRARIAETVATYVSGEEDRRWVEPALLTLLGLEPPPAGGRDVLFAAWRIFFERIAEHGTAVLLFEDLHWADSGLLDFTEHVLEWSKGVPLLIVTLTRPELFDRRPDFGSGSRYLTRLPLEPLGDAAMRALLHGFVPGLPESAATAILARADGIPLYAVETVRSLVADGRLQAEGGVYRPTGELGELAIPDTLRSLIASRLDALDPQDRSLVADASVLGQSFTLETLASVTGRDPDELDARLRALVRRELFDKSVDPRSPERGQYRFVQSLIREVAYGTLARRERRARHLAAARFYEGLGEDELAGLLAAHYVGAYEASAEGPEVDAVSIQARLALSGAAERAASLGAHDQAVSYLRQALPITPDAADRGAFLLRAASSADIAGRYDEAEALAGEAMELGRQTGDPVTVGRGQVLLAEAYISNGRLLDAVAMLEAAIEAYPEDAAPDVRAELLSNLSRALMRTSRLRESIEAADRALDLAEHLGLERVIAETFNNKGSSLAYAGRRLEARALLQAAVDLARASGHVAAEIRALSNLAHGLDDVRRSREMFRSAGDLANRVGNRGLSTWALENARIMAYLLAEGWDDALAGDLADPGTEAPTEGALDEARRLWTSAMLLGTRGAPVDDLIDRIEALNARITDPTEPQTMLIMRAELALQRRDLATAHDLALQAVEPPLGGWALSIAVRAALWKGDLPAARAAADRLDADIDTSAGTKAARLAARAGIAALEGDPEGAMAGFREAMSLCRATNAHLEYARLTIDLALLVGPGHAFVREAAAEARSIFERVQARPYLEQLDAALTGAESIGNREGVPAH
jgi:class 3 adenylate cyclase/tetratricopeptide (TPR) repeat protein